MSHHRHQAFNSNTSTPSIQHQHIDTKHSTPTHRHQAFNINTSTPRIQQQHIDTKVEHTST
eukprot:266989-Amorphochlora_amoeboformis.AAC.1